MTPPLKPAGGWRPRSLFRRLTCLIGWCPCRTACDDTGCWGQCTICGKRAGFVSREQLRRICDAEVAAELTASQSRERALTEERDGLAASLTHVEKDAAIKQSALIEENSALTSENKALKELLTKVRGSIHITLRKFDEGAWGELGQRSSISVFRERLVGIDAALQQSHGGGE